MKKGKFVISLDFELFWGVRDVCSISQYGDNVRGVHNAVPQLLELAHKHGVRLTFAIVGLCFHKNKEELLKHIPSIRPSYNNKNLSPYNGYIEQLKDDEDTRTLHFAPSIIERIKEYPEMEIGTHTYSHYYCVDEGQTKEEFREDIKRSVEVAKENGISIQSLVFPRNQYKEEYLEVCNELGILCYRGNEDNLLHKASESKASSFFGKLYGIMIRGLRLLDTFVRVSGHNCYDFQELKTKLPINIPASRFFRPYEKLLSAFDVLKLHRIKSDMTYAAKHGKLFHLWFHPHNIGINTEKNLILLDKIMQHYQKLNEEYGFESLTMTELAKNINEND